MAPMMTYRMAQHLRRRKPIALLAEIDHPDGCGRFWTGIGNLYWRGQTWVGSGALGTVTPVKQTSDLVIQEIQFRMSGISQDIAAKLNGDVRNRSGKVWLAGIGKGNTVISDPMLIADSELDYQAFDASEDGSVSVVITARTGFYTLERAIDEVWSTEDQKLRYPNDSGLDMIPALQNQDVQWTPN